MKQEVAIKEDTSVAVIGGAWGAGGGDDFELSDVITPKILLMQPMSKLVVEEGKGKAGDFLDSLEQTVLGDGKKPIEIIVFDKFKNWKVSDMSSGLKKWVRYDDYRASDGDLDWEFQEDGKTMRRDKTLTYSVLLVKDGVVQEMPYKISFSSSTYKNARRLQSYIEKLRIQGKNSASSTFKLLSKKETNEKGTFYVIDVSVGRPTTQEEQAMALNWYLAVKSGEAKLQDHEIDDEIVTEGAVAKPRQTYTVDDADDIEF